MPLQVSFHLISYFQVPPVTETAEVTLVPFEVSTTGSGMASGHVVVKDLLFVLPMPEMVSLRPNPVK